MRLRCHFVRNHLGLTVRHLTGSSYLQKLLSAFGHMASYDTISRLETAIASQQLISAHDVPEGFAKGAPAMMSSILQKVDVLVFAMLLIKLPFNMLTWCLYHK